MSAPASEAAKTAIALLLLARVDQSAVDERLASMDGDELRDLGRWLSLVLSARCGWSTETMATWRLRQELVSS